jgi:glycopeptide antibiotics resistance protein
MPTRAPRPRWAIWLLAPAGPGAILGALVEWIRDDLGFADFRQGWIEAPANVVLFIPLGFLLTLLLRRAWVGVLLAVMLSVSAELVQVLLPDRLPSLRDVVANASGAVIGAALAWLYTVSRRRGVHSHGPSDSPE